MKAKLLLIILFFISKANVKSQNFDIQQITKSKKIDWTGSVGTSAGFYYSSSNNFSRGNPFSVNLTGNLNIRLFDTWSLPFNFIIGKYQSTFTKPVIQIGISPNYKWAKFYIGHNNITFNPYTLDGISFLGAGIELNPGKLRLTTLYGRLKPAIETEINNGTQGSFKRMGYGIKLGIGDKKNFVDLMYFESKDNANSIDSWKDPVIQKQLGDASILRPQKNITFGLSSKVSVTPKFNFDFDGGVSLMNNDISDPNNRSINLINLLDANKLNYAFKTSINYNFNTFIINSYYERISSDYVTFGSYFFNNDLENFVISPSGVLKNGKCNFNISVGLQRNNLNKSKKETTKRFIGNANIYYSLNEKINMALNYNNFSVNQTRGTLPISDSFLLKQVNQTFTFTPNYTITKDSSIIHNFSFTTNYNDVNDKNVLTKQFTNMKSSMLGLNHSTSFLKHDNSINSGLNYNRIKSAGIINSQIGISGGYSQSFIKQKLNTGININYNVSYVNSKFDGSVINGGVYANYQLNNRHSISLNTSLIATKSKQFENYIESSGSISYQVKLK